MQRRPELGAAARRELELFGQHADDGVREGVELNRLTDGVGSPGEPLLPCGVAQDYRPRCREQVLAFVEVPAEDRGDAERPEETIADARARHELGPGRRSDHVAAAVMDVERAEDRVQPLPVEVVGVGQIGARNLRRALRDVGQPAPVAVWQRCDERRIDQSEDGDARSHPEADHQHGGYGEGRALDELPRGKAEILHHVVDHVDTPRIATFLFALLDTGDRAPGRLPRRLGAHPAAMSASIWRAR